MVAFRKAQLAWALRTLFVAYVGILLTGCDSDVAIGGKSLLKGRTLRGHSGAIHSVAFSPDGSTLASASRDGTVMTWDVATGQHKSLLRSHSSEVLDVTFSFDGKKVACAGADGAVTLSNVLNPGRDITLRGHPNAVWCAAFRIDGQTLASASYDGTVILWDVITGRAMADFIVDGGPFWSLEFAPDVQTLAVGSDDGTVVLWDIDTRERKITLPPHRAPILSLAFSSDGRYLVTASTTRAWIYKVYGGELKTTATVPTQVLCVALSSNAETLAIGATDDITGDTAHTLTLLRSRGIPIRAVGHEASVFCVAFAPNSETVASGSADNTVRLWSRDYAAARTDVPLGGLPGFPWGDRRVF